MKGSPRDKKVMHFHKLRIMTAKGGWGLETGRECVCVCVCEREREGEIDIEGESDSCVNLNRGE